MIIHFSLTEKENLLIIGKNLYNSFVFWVCCASVLASVLEMRQTK